MSEVYYAEIIQYRVLFEEDCHWCEGTGKHREHFYDFGYTNNEIFSVTTAPMIVKFGPFTAEPCRHCGGKGMVIETGFNEYASLEHLLEDYPDAKQWSNYS